MKLLKFVTDAYEGKVALWKSFVFGYLVMLLPTTVMVGVAKEFFIQNINLGIAYFLTVFVQLYYIWITITLWKCAANADKKVYKVLARIYAVILGIIAAGMFREFFK